MGVTSGSGLVLCACFCHGWQNSLDFLEIKIEISKQFQAGGRSFRMPPGGT